MQSPMPTRDVTDAENRAARRSVTVRIAGKDYRIRSSADEGWLQGVASGVDEAMALVRDRTETVDSMDVAVLTALNLARELVLLREGHPSVASDTTGLRVDRRRLGALIELAEEAAGEQST